MLDHKYYHEKHNILLRDKYNDVEFTIVLGGGDVFTYNAKEWINLCNNNTNMGCFKRIIPRRINNDDDDIIVEFDKCYINYYFDNKITLSYIKKV